MIRILLLAMGLTVTAGISPACAVQSHRVEGFINFKSGEARANISVSEKGSIKFERLPVADERFLLKLYLTHIVSPKFTISSEIEAAVQKAAGGGEPVYQGRIQSNYTLIDFKPAREVEGEYSYSNGMLTIKNLVLGQLGFSGKLQVLPPFKADIEAVTRFLDIDSFMSMWLKEKKSRFDGYVTGKLALHGSGGNYLLTGDLDNRNVVYNADSFERIRINLDGYYPYVNTESIVTRTDGQKFALTGPFDLSDQINYLNQIRSLKVKPLLVESDDEIEWTFRSLKGDQAGKTEIKYLKRKSESLDNLQRQEGDILGIERTLEF